ncbi:hypothetical protein QLX67_12575, partial [Balneolaceae bacterium ANBcel3]|nr:hypothetical protein [Balneolaceae bacterium ANBcel3]
AHPEKARSPSTALATLIHTLEQLPRSVAPFDHAALVTIIHVQLGEKAFGTTPGYAELNATLRAHDPAVLKALGDKAVAMTHAIAKTWGLEIETAWTEVFEPAVNHPDSFSVLEQAWNSLERSGDTRGLTEFVKMEKPFSWSEDFGRFTHVFPGAMFGLGAGEDTPPLHDEYYDFPDDLIEPAVAYFGAIMDVIQNNT